MSFNSYFIVQAINILLIIYKVCVFNTKCIPLCNISEKPPPRDRHDWPLAAKPAPPVRSSSQPSVRDQRRDDEANVGYQSRTLPRDTKVVYQQEPEGNDRRDQYYYQNQGRPHLEQNGGKFLLLFNIPAVECTDLLYLLDFLYIL